MVYRQVLHIKPFKWCEITAGTITNPVTKFIVKLLNETIPGFVHPCPYDVVNVTDCAVKTSTVGSAFASGDYKVVFTLYDLDMKYMASALCMVYCNSSNKDTFG